MGKSKIRPHFTAAAVFALSCVLGNVRWDPPSIVPIVSDPGGAARSQSSAIELFTSERISVDFPKELAGTVIRNVSELFSVRIDYPTFLDEEQVSLKLKEVSGMDVIRTIAGRFQLDAKVNHDRVTLFASGPIKPVGWRLVANTCIGLFCYMLPLAIVVFFFFRAIRRGYFDGKRLDSAHVLAVGYLTYAFGSGIRNAPFVVTNSFVPFDISIPLAVLVASSLWSHRMWARIFCLWTSWIAVAVILLAAIACVTPLELKLSTTFAGVELAEPSTAIVVWVCVAVAVGLVGTIAALQPVHMREAFEKRPNQPPEPTALSVTPRAYARVAPASTVAHL